MAKSLGPSKPRLDKLSRLKKVLITYFVNPETRFRWSTLLGISLGFLLVASSFAAYRILMRPNGEFSQVLVPIVYVHVGILSILVGLVARRLMALWREHRRGQAGIRLHIQLLSL